MNSSPADMSSFWSASLQLWSNGIQGWNAAQGVCVRSGLYIFYLHLLIALIYLVEGWGARVCQMQRTTCRCQLFSSILWVPKVRTQVLRLGGQ